MLRPLLAVLAAILIGAAPPPPASPAAIDRAVHAAMQRTGARGAAVAVIDHGKVALVQSWGDRNAAGDPLHSDTVMYGASLTKAVFAYTAMQLVAEGRIDLDKPVAELLAEPLPDYGNLDAYGNWGDLAGDQRWRRITPRHILTHSTGFANFSFLEPDHKLHIHFDPGARYAYSGEGIILLQFAIEQGLGLDLGAEMQRRVFDRFGMTRTSMKWRADFQPNLADGWQADGTAVPHDERSRVRAAGSMDTTIEDFAKFAAGFIRGEGTSAEMLRPQVAITTKTQFPTLQPELPAAERWPNLSAGLGVVTFTGPQGPGFYKGGHDEQTANTWVCIERGRRCVVILSNDVRLEKAFPELVRTILGDTGVPYGWEYGGG